MQILCYHQNIKIISEVTTVWKLYLEYSVKRLFLMRLYNSHVTATAVQVFDGLVSYKILIWGMR